jgi:hypothetical protein
MSGFRKVAWLRSSLKAIDRVYFSDALSARDVRIRWAPWRPLKNYIQWGLCEVFDEYAVVTINRTLAWGWVPDFYALLTVFHEALHLTVGMDHDAAFLAAEARYPYVLEAKKWEKDNWDRLINATNPHARKTT